MVRIALFAILAVLSAPAAIAAEDCSDAPNQTEMNACAVQALRAAEAALNTAVEQAEARLKDNAAATADLAAAQAAWTAFRDTHCTFETSAAAEGTIRPSMIAMCQADMTIARTETIAGYLACTASDLDCPVPPAP